MFRNDLNITWNVVDEKCVPIKGTESASCWDLKVHRFIKYKTEGFIENIEKNNEDYVSLGVLDSLIIGTGVSLVLPKNILIYIGQSHLGVDLNGLKSNVDILNINKAILSTVISPRSGLGFKYDIEPFHGEIDNDYHNEIKIKITNNGYDEYKINKYDKIAQLKLQLIPVLPETVKIVKSIEELEISPKRKGFGSTGR